MRLVSRTALVLALLSFGGASGALAQSAPAAPAAAPDSVKQRLLREVLAQTHAIDLMYQAMEASVPMQRAANPSIPPVFWDRFLAATRERRTELEAMVTTIYDRHFTADELRQLIAFYGTPVGKKLISEQPAITQEAMVAAREWGQRLGMEVGQQLAGEAKKSP